MKIPSGRLDLLSPQQKRALLAKLIREKRAPAIHPASYGQRALWHVQRLMPDSPVYNVAVAWLVRSELDVPALKRTFQWLVDRHAALRTTYGQRGGEPVQITHPRGKPAFTLHQASELSDSELDRELAEAAHRPFDLEKGPLLRVDLYLREAGRHLLLVCFHHIAVDLWSSTYIFDEVRRLYPIAREGGRPQPPTSGTGFNDYVRWQRELLDGPDGERLWNFWKQQFPLRLPPFRLPIRLSSEPRQSYSGALHPFIFERHLTEKLRAQARQNRTTLYVLLMAGFEALLHRYSRQNEFLLRSLTVGRSRAQFENVIGFFANPVVIRADLGDDPTFTQLIQRVRETVSRTIEHQDYPFELIMERLRFGRDITYNPNPEVMFILQTPQRFVSIRGEKDIVGSRGIFAPGPTGIRLDLGGLVVEKYNPIQRVTLNELAIEMAEVGNVLSGAAHYRTDLFAALDIARLTVHYRKIMAAMAADPGLRVSAFKPEGGFPKLPPTGSGDIPVPDETADRPGPAVPPRDPIESLVSDIWKAVLRRQDIGVFDDFFRLGGNSIQAVQLITRVQEALRVDLPLRRIFEVRTIAGLADLLRERQIQPPAVRIEAVERGEKMPLSFAQERVWFIDQLAGGRALFNIPIAVRLKGPLDPKLLERALNTIIRRHEVLRTAFFSEDGRPWQRILASRPIRIRIEDISGAPRSRRLAKASQAAAAEAQVPFDLTNDPLLRAGLFKLDDEDHVAVLTLHHIVSDGWSFGVLFREMAQLYAGGPKTKSDPLPVLPIQYADYAVWQRKWLSGEDMDRRVSERIEGLKGIPPLDLPADRPRPPVQTFHGACRSFRLSAELVRRLRKLAEEEEVTLYMVLLAAFLTLILRYTGQDDLAVGSPAAGRNRVETEDLIGCFFNVLVLRSDLSGNPSFRQLLERVRKTTLEAFAHQDLPFEKIVEALRPERDLSRPPLTSVMFAYQNMSLPPLRIPGGPDLSVLDIERGTAHYDLTLFVAETGEGLSSQMEYNTAIFEAKTIDRMASHFRNLLEGIVSNPNGRLWELPLLGKEERRNLLSASVESADIGDREATALQLFEEQARLTPEAPALSDSDRTLTYRELEAAAERLSERFIAHGAGPGNLIGIHLERSAGLVAALLGCWKCGAAWIPLDPGQPEKRTRLILEDAGVKLVLSSRAFARDLIRPDSGITILPLEDDILLSPADFTSRTTSRIRPGDAAYVIYTSGTTGTPKGVVISHRALANYLTWCRDAYSIRNGSRVPLHSSPAYDFTITSLFAALISGGCVVIVPPGPQGALSAGLDVYGDWDLLKLTPLHAQRLGEILGSAVPGVRTLVIGGEELLPEHIASWRRHSPETVIYNEYGPTEATVGCLAYRLPKSSDPEGHMPIGRPIAHTHAYILDSFLNPVPIGVPGELYIAGRCLADGYLHRPDLTAERFPPDPFHPEMKARMYRTGDMARRRPSGEIEFLGRRDRQIKLRGYRIEPAEIESALHDHPQVRRAVVAVMDRSERSSDLTAFIEPAPRARPDKTELRRFLQERLPEYMIPRRFVYLDAIPLSPAGKVNPAALPELGPEPPAAEGIAPSGPLERELAAIWKKVLGLDLIGVHEDFFEMGGHSLSALRVLSEIKSRLALDPPLRTVFEAPTIAQLAARLETLPGPSSVDSQNLSPKPGWRRLRTGDKRCPLFCVHPAGGGVEVYRSLVRHLEPGLEVLGIFSRALFDPAREYGSVTEMGRAYADLIRSRRQAEPIFLLGWSFGGAVAHATAAALEAGGEEIGFLGLLDTVLPAGAVSPLSGEIQEYVHGLLKEAGGRTVPNPASLLPPGFMEKIAALPPREVLGRIIGHLQTKAGRRIGIPTNILLPILRLVDVHERMLAAYRPHPLRTPIFLWRAQDVRRAETTDSDTSRLTRGQVTAFSSPGGHYSMLISPHAAHLAEEISGILKGLRDGGCSPFEGEDHLSR